MLTRILTGIVAFLVFLPFLVHEDTIAYPIGMSICAMVSVYELIRCVGLHKKLRITIPLCLAALAFPLCMAEEIFSTTMAFTVGIAASLVLMLYMLTVTVFSRGRIDIEKASTSLMVSLYIMAAFACMVYLSDYCAPNIFLLVFIGAWVPDTFAYFTGRLFGKHKLIPDVSPKKTVEGAVGGVVFCIFAFILFAIVYNYLNADQLSANGYRPLPIWFMAIVGFLAALVSMVGDLTMSVIKRHYGIKDYGKILPGHGGFLDRFDSVLAVAIILAVAFGVASHAGFM